MRKFLSVLIGFVILAAAALVLWAARSPLPRQSVTTGEALAAPADALTLRDLAPDLAAPSGAGAPAPAPDGQGGFEALAGAAPLTTDIVLNPDAEVALAVPDPLALQAAAAAAEETRGGPVVPTTFEQRVVELEWPSEFRAGGSGAVRLKLKPLEDGSLQPVAEIADNEIVATPIQIADRYDTHNVTVTATLSAPDFRIEALNSAQQALERGRDVEWRWTLSPDGTGRSVIVVGLTAQWDAKSGDEPGWSASLWGQALQVDVNYVFGLITVPQASIAGTVLAVLGFVAEIPLIDAVFEVFGKVLFGGRRRSRKNR